MPEVEGECLNEDIVEEDSEERGENVDEGDVEHDAAPGEHSLNSLCYSRGTQSKQHVLLPGNTV